MPHVSLYKGYSSFEYERSGSFRLTDVELVKMDILNHIFTRKGSRPKMANFGTTIPDLLFEPIDEALIEEIEDELTTVINYDPRVELMTLKVLPSTKNRAVVANATIRYIEFDIIDQMNLNIQFL